MTKVLEKPGLIDDKTAEIVAVETILQLGARGYCLWKCALLEGEVIMLVNGKRSDQIPAGYTIYTVEEIDRSFGMSVDELRRLHRVKKITGATLISFEKREKEKDNGEQQASA
jgi:hypothetical protein